MTLTGSRALTQNSSADVTISGAIGDGGNAYGFTKAGTGNLILSGTNTYTGTTTVNAGTLALTGSLRFKPTTNGITNSIAGTGTATINGKFVVDLTGASTTSGNSWTLVDKPTLTATFSDTTFGIETSAAAAFTDPENDGVWTLVDGSNTWNFSEANGKLTVTSAVSGYAAWQPPTPPAKPRVRTTTTTAWKTASNTSWAHPVLVHGHARPGRTNRSPGRWIRPTPAPRQVQTSPDLGTWTPATVGVGAGFVAITPATSVTYTFTAPAGKRFVRLLVNPN